ncbi:MAG: hypothetical protein H6972_17175, partial [Gammaproteobacteria bacterium]|nr:hypothetical protein [Gammaproteobacteria bacterium]
MDADIRRDFKALLLAQPFWDETRDRRAFLRDLFAGHPLYRYGLGRVAISPATGQQGQKTRESEQPVISDSVISEGRGPRKPRENRSHFLQHYVKTIVR